VTRAARARLDDWLACFEPILCDDAEPPRVIVAFTIGTDGRIHDVRVDSVRRRIWVDGSIAERAGDLDGRLGRCLVAVVEQLDVQLPRSEEVEVRYAFAPDLVDCAGTLAEDSPSPARARGAWLRVGYMVVQTVR